MPTSGLVVSPPLRRTPGSVPPSGRVQHHCRADVGLGDGEGDELVEEHGCQVQGEAHGILKVGRATLLKLLTVRP